MATDSSDAVGTSALGDLDVITVGRLFVPVAIILGWQGLSLWLGSSLIPGPALTFERLYTSLAEGRYTDSLANTLLTLAIGFVIAAVTGFAGGVALGTRDLAYDLFEPFILNTYAIPKIVLFPIFIFIFKLGIDQKIAFAAFHGFFPMLIITMNAVRETPDIYLKAGRSLRLTRAQMARYVVFPFVLVHLIVALRLAFSLTFLGVVLAELFAAKSGLGLLLAHAMHNFDTQTIMTITVLLMLIAFAVNIALYAVQRTLERRWNLTAEVTE